MICLESFFVWRKLPQVYQREAARSASPILCPGPLPHTILLCNRPQPRHHVHTWTNQTALPCMSNTAIPYLQVPRLPHQPAPFMCPGTDPTVSHNRRFEIYLNLQRHREKRTNKGPGRAFLSRKKRQWKGNCSGSMTARGGSSWCLWRTEALPVHNENKLILKPADPVYAWQLLSASHSYMSCS